MFEWYKCIRFVVKGTDALASFHRQSTTVSAWVPPQFVRKFAFLVDLWNGSSLRHPYCKMFIFVNLVVPASRQTPVLVVVLLYIAPPNDYCMVLMPNLLEVMSVCVF